MEQLITGPSQAAIEAAAVLKPTYKKSLLLVENLRACLFVMKISSGSFSTNSLFLTYLRFYFPF